MTEDTKVRAPKRTPKRWVEEQGFAAYYSMLRDADVESVARHLRAGPVTDAADAFRLAQERAQAILDAASARQTEAIEADKAAQAVVAKLAALKATAEQ